AVPCSSAPSTVNPSCAAAPSGAMVPSPSASAAALAWHRDLSREIILRIPEIMVFTPHCAQKPLVDNNKILTFTIPAGSKKNMIPNFRVTGQV
ncbi:MAG: hypothetical protein JJU09_10135, partial [Rhodobacteraceae bacterium]|nr:hypothetical protein [Paracoccaceae bacterium]